MEFINRDAPKNYNVFLIGDVHIGTLLHYEKGFNICIGMLNKNYMGASHNIAVGMGDYLEAIDTSDRRFDIDTVSLEMIRPDKQREHFEEKIKHVSHKFACLLFGNHEGTLLRYYDYIRSVCSSLNIQYGTYSSIIKFPTWKLFATHGYGTIRSTADDPIRRDANLKLSLKRKLKDLSGDCAIMAMGHVHQLIINEPNKTLYISSNGKDLKQNYIEGGQTDKYIHPDHRWYVASGSFLRTFLNGVSGYAERAMYAPNKLGFPIIRVRNEKIVGVDPIYV